MRQIVLCADDYGQNEAISRGILKLVDQNRISAVSCMVTEENWPFYASLLRPYIDQVDIGLHFNLTEKLTEENPVHSLVKLLLGTHLRLISRKKIAAEFQSQLLRFQTALEGKLPDFVDGHQHIHQFPVISDIVLPGCAKLLKNPFYVRYVVPNLFGFPKQSWFKKIIIMTVTDWNFKNKLKKLNISYNQSFEGIYEFKLDGKYQNVFINCLEHIKHRGLIMCHPGLKSFDRQDKLALTRPIELEYLLSEDFLADMKKAGVEITRFSNFY
ncbi:MAG: ChbG/HpnK family deacetylase [Gammaproteobacteria bacterium]|nr:ChbG/HpnK family deacetylase [Gammaproteobacteria bacterium]